MSLIGLLSIAPGECVAVVGAGGKTSVIAQLRREAAPMRVLIAPTTRIMMPQVGVRCLGRSDAASGKLLAAPLPAIEEASRDHDLTLMEADGSKALPLKGWADHEPVVPEFTTLTLGVIGARALGLMATGENVHRLPRFLTLTGLDEGDAVDANAIAHMILSPGGMMARAVGRRALLVNQADAYDPEPIARAVRALEAHLIILAGSALRGEWRTF